MNPKKSGVDSMSTEQLWQSSNRFNCYSLAQFKKYDKAMIKLTKTQREIIDAEEKAFERHCCIAFPRNKLTQNGEPYWDDHPAKKQLADDVRNRKVLTNKLKPLLLRDTRAEYKEFAPKTFLTG